MLDVLRMHRIWIMSLCTWREARGESESAQTAVIFTILERARNKQKWEGTNIVGAVTAKWQYSSMSDPRDRQLTYFPQENDTIFYRICELAELAMDGLIQNPMPGADSYFDDSIKGTTLEPKWATADRYVGKIDRLNFYRVLS